MTSCSTARCVLGVGPHDVHQDDRGRRWVVIDHVVVAPATSSPAFPEYEIGTAITVPFSAKAGTVPP